jgi:DNA excision repair protein ERCC-2
MCEVYKCIKGKGHALLEMPNASGKIVSLLSVICSHLTMNRGLVKFVYCTRTEPEMEVVLNELRFVIEYIKKCIANEMMSTMIDDDYYGDDGLVAIAFCSKKNLCVNQNVNISYDALKTESDCRSRTASWLRQERLEEVCKYYLGFEQVMKSKSRLFTDGVYSTHDLNKLGVEHGWCPYYTARYALEFANIIVCPYEYILDQKTSHNISKYLSKLILIVLI